MNKVTEAWFAINLLNRNAREHSENAAIDETSWINYHACGAPNVLRAWQGELLYKSDTDGSYKTIAVASVIHHYHANRKCASRLSVTAKPFHHH
ncbi:hypothetical protein [Pasteurella multocida]|uniref:hypothetical protein n=1 Tax=Pasteurella multocida TaxID=747 RepID=UPI001D0FD415|nr:hypothetical protein [Pasteurella multocida]